MTLLQRQSRQDYTFLFLYKKSTGFVSIGHTCLSKKLF
jgi:hypothetical protein